MAPDDWVVGQELPPLEIEEVSRTTLALFAGASGDHNPIHLDIDIARSAGLDDVFAHGMLSMAYLARLVTDLVPQHRLKRYNVRFTAITPVRGRPVARARVATIDESTGQRLATLALDVRLADGTTTLQGEALVSLD